MSDSKAKGVKIGGLWNNRNGNGMSGKLGFARICIFPNKKKQDGSKSPDWEIVLFEDERKDGEKPAPTEAARPPANDDDVPF